MPQPAYRCATRPAQERAAERDAELPVLGQVGPPHRARVPAAVEALERRNQRQRAPRAARRRPPASAAACPPAPRPAPDPPAGRGSEWPGAARSGPSPARARRPPATQRLTGSSVRSIRRATIACSSRSLALCSSCSPRWSSTDGSALRRVVPASATVWARGAVAAHEQLRAGPDEGQLGRADAPAEAGREGAHAARRAPPPGRAADDAWARTSRASTIFSSSPLRIRSTARSTACS